MDPLTEFAAAAGPAADLSLLIARLGSVLFLVFAAWSLFGLLAGLADHGRFSWSVVGFAAMRLIVALTVARFLFS